MKTNRTDPLAGVDRKSKKSLVELIWSHIRKDFGDLTRVDCSSLLIIRK